MIKGWIPTTLIDFPGHIASTLFMGGCNLRCPMCHNPDLVLQPEGLPDIPVNYIMDTLEKHKGKITGVVLSGGEPCLSAELMTLAPKLGKMGLAIKLDTNGYLPDVLGRILAQGWISYIAMDIKATIQKYPTLCGLKTMDLDRITASIDLIRGSGVRHEFRTTVVPTLITEQDIISIAKWLPSTSKYVLQQFRPQGCLDQDYNHLTPYSSETLRRMQALAKNHIQEVAVRGI